MKYALAGFCALIALAAMAAQAGAGQSRRVITLRLGDAFVVGGTDLACEAQVGTKVMKGAKLISCFKVRGGSLAADSYVSALGADGRVAVARVKANGRVGATVFNRRPAVVGSSVNQFTVRAGDRLLLAGTDLACGINDDRSGIYPTCFRVAPKGGLPGSYAFAETDRFVAVVRFDSTGKKTTLVFKRQQGR